MQRKKGMYFSFNFGYNIPFSLMVCRSIVRLNKRTKGEEFAAN